MTHLLDIYFTQFLIFVLVLGRIGGLVMTAPIFGSRSVPLQVRGLIAIGLALLITPLHWREEVTDPGSILGLTLLLVEEIMLGVALGMGVKILFIGLQVSGQLVSHMTMLGLAEVADPSNENTVSVFTQLFDVVAVSVFLIIGGHRLVMAALLDTFQWMPPGRIVFSSSVSQALVDVLAHSFVLGVRAAAPTVVAVLMSILVMGLISRTLPQLNILVVGTTVNSTVMLGALVFSLGIMVWIFQENVVPTVDAMWHALATGRPFEL
jgi:flagellar biosynthetic protein FliR